MSKPAKCALMRPSLEDLYLCTPCDLTDAELAWFLDVSAVLRLDEALRIVEARGLLDARAAGDITAVRGRMAELVRRLLADPRGGKARQRYEGAIRTAMGTE